MYGDGIAFSVDGDFIPISLMYHENQLRNLHENPGDDSSEFRLSKISGREYSNNQY